MRAGANLEIDIGRRDAEFAEEAVGHGIVVVLPGMHHDLLNASGDAGAMDGRELGKVRPCADDVEKLHVEWGEGRETDCPWDARRSREVTRRIPEIYSDGAHDQRLQNHESEVCHER